MVKIWPASRMIILAMSLTPAAAQTIRPKPVEGPRNCILASTSASARSEPREPIVRKASASRNIGDCKRDLLP